MRYTETLKQAGLFGTFTRSALSLLPGFNGVSAASSMASKLKGLISGGANTAQKSFGVINRQQPSMLSKLVVH